MGKKETSKKDAVEADKEKDYQPPKGQKKVWPWKIDGKAVDCNIVADWILIRKKEKPVADLFYTYYSCGLKGVSRPVTFVFNGGPGASSSYLHVGALGPKKITFGVRGECPALPVVLKDNEDSWLNFTDLVFVDPVGTGFSRSLGEIDLTPTGKKEEDNKEESGTLAKEFYQMNRDLESIGEFIQKFLSKYKRWSSPVFIAGESYGGFRVAKLSRMLQEDYGVGLSGVILISPCLELHNLCSDSDYNILHWIESFPTMVASAVYHKKSSYFADREKEIELGADLEAFLKPVENFAMEEMSHLLIQGEIMDTEKRKVIIKKISDFMGLSFEQVNKVKARVLIEQFSRWLLQKERKWCGLYDTSVTAYDPFPNRDIFEGPDPSLSGVESAFGHGINTLLRELLELDCERQYRLLNMEVNKNWSQDKKGHFFDLQIGATDDLRYAMSMNPMMKVFAGHGVFDLVTPYFSSKRILQSMNLPVELKKQVHFCVFHGGHMFYTWDHSRRSFRLQMENFYKG